MTERFKVDLRGVIDLAANHLYTSSDVFVREVIQNAIDALTARRRLDAAFKGSVRLELTAGEEGKPSTLTISDNGVGLTTAEVHTFLSTVGGSSKREEAELVAERATEEDDGGFLGRFGIGLLSCFMVTDEIVVVTRSAREPASPAVEWRGRADGSYSVRELSESTLLPGTSVYLTAKEGAEEFYERERLIELARQYAEMLPHKIVVAIGSDEFPINRGSTPWEMEPSSEIELNDLCEHSLGFKPIDTFKISVATGAIEGYAFIRPDTNKSWGGSHRLYSRGMFVSEHVHGLVPTWATFVGVVLNTKALRLTASRESVHHDDTLTECSEAIGAAIRARLIHLLRNDRSRFEAIMHVHYSEIRGLAVKEPEFFELIIDLLEFDTTLGSIRFGEFRRDNDRLLVARTTEQFRRLSPIATAAGIRIFNGGYTYHEELLSRAAERFPELEVHSFDSADMVELWAEPQDMSVFDNLIAAGHPALEGRLCEIAIREFVPAEIPAFFALGLDAEFHRQLDRTKSQASGLWNEILDAMAPRPENLPPTRLCLNSNSPLVRQLGQINDPELVRIAVQVLYVQALMSGQHALTSQEMELLHSSMENMLTRCVSQRGQS